MDETAPEQQPEDLASSGGGPVPVGATTAVIGLFGAVVTVGGLWLAERRADTAVTEVLAGVTVGLGVLAVAAAVFGAVRALIARPRAAGTVVAAVLSVLGLVLGAVTGLVTAYDEPGTPRYPQANVQLSRASGDWLLTVQVSTPGLSAGDVMDVQLLRNDGGSGDFSIGRSLTSADGRGVATATLVTSDVSDGEVKLVVLVPGRDCTRLMPLLNATRIVSFDCKAR
ncbi:hypothetical protein [Actinoplanes awajinensis]|uniref:Uncharacterized protein n=1 Tax=Actinoplanes awajinensis subsp. mycoplanecinus TaxID=135947 RepID=A0A0X3VA78_9ACTN|nr:hypothetical protein [Actinoplanes awajinensis]KUL41337.1 hypothetical protein ADL15_03515 [Actinoplanes awajinensis subsp. mycoplanecinus]